jgi:hypothetical protein
MKVPAGQQTMDLPLDPRLSIGIQTLHRRTEPASGPWLPRIDELLALVEFVDRCGYDSVWVGLAGPQLTQHRDALAEAGAAFLDRNPADFVFVGKLTAAGGVLSPLGSDATRMRDRGR